MAPKGNNINVSVRVRPLSSKETTRGSHSCVVVQVARRTLPNRTLCGRRSSPACLPPPAQDAKQININDPDDKMGGIDYLRLDRTKDKSYAFDNAFDDAVPQETVFEKTTRPLVPDVMRGSNATCFAYGATGSGKTHTMMGSFELPGVIPQTADELFEAIRQASEEYLFTVKIQYVEIYNESIKDLLEPSNNSALDVREHPKDGTSVANAAMLVVSSRKELEALIHKGNLFRATESTNVNAVSSRSHAVLQLKVESRSRFENSKKIHVGKLSLIDLAGSERAKKTGNEGKRLQEGQNIM